MGLDGDRRGGGGRPRNGEGGGGVGEGDWARPALSRTLGRGPHDLTGRLSLCVHLGPDALSVVLPGLGVACQAAHEADGVTEAPVVMLMVTTARGAYSSSQVGKLSHGRLSRGQSTCREMVAHVAVPTFLPRHRPLGPQHLGIWGKCGASGIITLCLGQPRPCPCSPFWYGRFGPVSGSAGTEGARDEPCSDGWGRVGL